MTTTHSDSKPREHFLVGLVFLLVIVANVPPDLLNQIGIAREIVLSVLGLLIVLALFLYLRFFFFMLYVLLVVGANLPDHWAQSLQLERIPLIIALACMVIGSSLNYVGYFMPTGLGKQAPRENKDALTALLRAIERQQLWRIKAILEVEFNLNQADENGLTPLKAAEQTGNTTIVSLLVAAGATPG